MAAQLQAIHMFDKAADEVEADMMMRSVSSAWWINGDGGGGRTPLEVAKAWGNKTCVQLLQEAGAS